MKLFGHPDSGHAFKVRLFLQVAGINHDYEYVDIHQSREQRSAEFREHARYGEVPLLIDGGKAYVQSNAILLYLCQQFGRWGGEDADTFNACAEWLLWEANKTGLCLPQLRSFHKGDADAALEAAIPWLKARYEHDINVLEAEFSDGREWIIGSQAPSIADFSLCGYLVFADEAQVAVPANVSAWLDRLSRLEGWQPPYQLLATD